MVATLVVSACCWAAGWWLLWRVPRLPPAAGAAPAVVDLTVVVPARDEAASLPTLLAALEAARPAPSRIVLVDDGSVDGTDELARAFADRPVDGQRRVALAAPERDEGWNGKQWACHVGALEAADEGPLVFVDADVAPEPDLFGRLAAALDAQGGGLLSVQPLHRAGSSR